MSRYLLTAGSAFLLVAPSISNAVIVNTAIIVTDVGAGNDDISKMHPDTLATLASYRDNVFGNIASIPGLPNGNFSVIERSASGPASAALVATDSFTGLSYDQVAGSRSATSNIAGSDGGMSNRFGEIFLSKGRSGSSSDGAHLNGLNNTLPILNELSGGYFDEFDHGAALSNGNWVLGGSNGSGRGSIEVRDRSMSPRVAIFGGFDLITAINTNIQDKIGAGGSGGANGDMYALSVSGSSLNIDASLRFVGTPISDIESLSNGDWVVSMNDANGVGRVAILREDGAGSFTVIDDLTGLPQVNALGVQTDDDILIGTQTGVLSRYSSSLDLQASVSGLSPITNITVLVPEPSSMFAVVAFSLVGLRRKK